MSLKDGVGRLERVDYALRGKVPNVHIGVSTGCDQLVAGIAYGQ